MPWARFRRTRIVGFSPPGGSALCGALAVLLLLRDGGQGFCKFIGASFGPLFGFQDKRLLPIQIDSPSAERAIAIIEVQRLLKNLVVLRFVRLRGFMFRQFE